jgi:hypothetical protein
VPEAAPWLVLGQQAPARGVRRFGQAVGRDRVGILRDTEVGRRPSAETVEAGESLDVVDMKLTSTITTGEGSPHR